MIRLYTTPFFIRMLYPSLVWKMPDDGKKIYLTFDDGPHPIITVKVLELLKKYNAKATFFCVGNNVKANKEVVEKIREDSAGTAPEHGGQFITRFFITQSVFRLFDQGVGVN